MQLELNSIEVVLAELAAGRPIVLVDDKDRENEGDLVVVAELITPEQVNFMARECRGLICLSLPAETIAKLNLPMQVTDNTSPFGTNFTVSMDHASLGVEGVTARGRAKTIFEASQDGARAEDFVRPGYVFPLRAVPGGVLKRRGQTEGSVDLARLAGVRPAAAICEIIGENGEMLRGEALQAFCVRHGLKIASVQQIVEYRLQNEVFMRRVAETEFREVSELGIHGGMKGEFGTLKVIVYVDDVEGKEHMAIIKGDPKNGAPVRIHSECLTGDVFGSCRCDCGPQLNRALSLITAEGAGVIVYLFQEGRGIGLGNKLRAYELQDQGLDTVEANLKLGFSADMRTYRAGANILNCLGLSEVKLITNNPDKVRQLEALGVKVTERIPLIAGKKAENEGYLQTKRDKMGHLLAK